MTANAMIGDRDKCIRYGMDEYISKPIDIDRLTSGLLSLSENDLNTPLQV